MGMFRSEEIVHKRIRMPGNINRASKILNEILLYEEDLLEFIDLTKDDIEAKKNLAPLIGRCEEMEKILNKFQKFAEEFGMNIHKFSSHFEFVQALTKDQSNINKQETDYFDAVEAEILEEEKKIIELLESYNKIKEDYFIDIQKEKVIEKYILLTSGGRSNQNGLRHIVGICDSENDLKLKRMLFRIGHDKIIITSFDLIQTTGLFKKPKKIFIIFSPQSEYLLGKISKICDIFNCIRFNIPENLVTFPQDIQKKIRDEKTYLFEAKKAIINFLQEKLITTNKLSLYKLYFEKEKLIFTNLNKCIIRDNFIDGEVWIIKSSYEKVKKLVCHENESISANFIDLIDCYLQKPTYIKTNSFTFPFQQIANLYGIPYYREINPGYFTIITFPFFFGIMFGDIGHGIILLIAGLYLALSKGLEDIEFLKNIMKYKYFILLLGIFSIFCGFIYNDFFSIPLNLFGSCYEETVDGVAVRKENCVYKFGIDPKWYIAENQLSFFNSFKMKFSVIVGVLQMTFGILLKGLNDTYQCNCVNFIFEFIPQLIFMVIIFGYMIFMIYYKWCIDWSQNVEKAPSLITIMINMVIKQGKVDTPLWSNNLIDQVRLNQIIMIIALSLIPIMLFPKPIINFLKNKSKRGYKKNEGLIQNEEGNQGIGEENKYSNDMNCLSSSIVIDPNSQFSHLFDLERNKIIKKRNQENFIELFIHQLIYTIEFCLSTVSNTASYLRLWALSLAHAELSKVFIESTFLEPVQKGDLGFGLTFVVVFIDFFIFANATLFVLIFMDSMECGLHTLRLHWVEFQNKFYRAEGYEFKPFCFKSINEQKD